MSLVNSLHNMRHNDKHVHQSNYKPLLEMSFYRFWTYQHFISVKFFHSGGKAGITIFGYPCSPMISSESTPDERSSLTLVSQDWTLQGSEPVASSQLR